MHFGDISSIWGIYRVYGGYFEYMGDISSLWECFELSSSHLSSQNNDRKSRDTSNFPWRLHKQLRMSGRLRCTKVNQYRIVDSCTHFFHFDTTEKIIGNYWLGISPQIPSLDQALEVFLFFKTSNPTHPQGTVVTKMIEQKHLGLTLDSSLSFRKHLNQKNIKAKKNLGIIVRSHLDYCDIIYHMSSARTQFGVILTNLMEKSWKNSIPSSSCCYPVHGKVQVIPNSTRN